MKGAGKCGFIQKLVKMKFLVSPPAVKEHLAISASPVYSAYPRLSNHTAFMFSSLSVTELDIGKVLLGHFGMGHRQSISFSGTQVSDARQSIRLYCRNCIW